MKTKKIKIKITKKMQVEMNECRKRCGLPLEKVVPEYEEEAYFG